MYPGDKATSDRSDMGVQDTFQGALCEQAREESLPIADEEPSYERPPAVDSDDEQYEVERLLDKRRIGRGFQYLVKWRGYPNSENLWLKRKDINPDIVTAYEAELMMGSQQL